MGGGEEAGEGGGGGEEGVVNLGAGGEQMGGGFWCGPAEGAELIVDVTSVELSAHEFPGKCLDVGAKLGFLGGRVEVGERSPMHGAPLSLAC